MPKPRRVTRGPRASGEKRTFTRRRSKGAIYLAVMLLLLAALACNLPREISLEKPTPTATTLIIEATFPPLIPLYSATPPGTTPLAPTAYPVTPPSALATAQPTSAVTLPPAPTTGTQLAFLSDGDVWLVAIPSGSPQPLTNAGNLLSFAWAPDGSRLATFDGKNLCFVQADGSVRTACLELGLNDQQAQIERRIVWSPDQRYIVLWNAVNPWDEGAIGWLVVSLNGSNQTWRIEDPVDWGASLSPNNEPGGITGQPLFLPDGRLLGTLTHRYLCGSGGCHYRLYEFDLQGHNFKVFPNKPEEGWSDGLGLVLSRDGSALANYGAFTVDCDTYVTFMDLFNLGTQTRQLFDLDQDFVAELALAPDSRNAVISRTSSCPLQDELLWARTCGLSQGLDVLPMQIWSLESDQRQDLVPGLSPAWSPDGLWIAFRSCLVPDPSGVWEVTPQGPPAVYFWDVFNRGLIKLMEGAMPQWKP